MTVIMLTSLAPPHRLHHCHLHLPDSILPTIAPYLTACTTFVGHTPDHRSRLPVGLLLEPRTLLLTGQEGFTMQRNLKPVGFATSTISF